MFDHSPSVASGSDLSARIGSLQRELQSMKDDEFICMQSGWTTPDGGHAITVNFHRTSAAEFALIVINSGQGVGAHPSRSSTWPTVTGGSKLAMRFEGIPEKRITDEVGLWMLLKQTSSASSDHKPFAFYNVRRNRMKA